MISKCFRLLQNPVIILGGFFGQNITDYEANPNDCIRSNYSLLVKNLLPETLQDHLAANELSTCSFWENLKCRQTTRLKNDLILKAILRKGKHECKMFLDIIDKIQPHIWKDIQAKQSSNVPICEYIRYILLTIYTIISPIGNEIKTTSTCTACSFSFILNLICCNDFSFNIFQSIYNIWQDIQST